MGSTANPQDDRSCPNCSIEANDGAGDKDQESILLLECHNENCAVDRFWGTSETHA